MSQLNGYGISCLPETTRRPPTVFRTHFRQCPRSATIQAMGKPSKRVRRGCLACVVILLVATLAGGAYYIHQDVRGVTHAALRDFQGAKADAARLLESTRLAFKTRGCSPLSKARSDGEEPARSKEDIQVFFAPCNPISPLGIDDRLVGLLKSAGVSIDCAFYELRLQKVAKVLIAKQKDGVKVRVVSDSHYEDRDALQDCIEAGIPVVFDRREPLMHNKFCVVDGARVWTGSTNITENGMYRNNNNAVLITSDRLAADFTNEFEEMFVKKRFGARSPKNTIYPQFRVGDVLIECYFAPEDGVQREILSEIADAETTIDFMAFSFTSKEIAKAMVARMADNVTVRGLFEMRDAGSKYSRDDYLAEHGAEVHLDKNKYAMHHKVVILDGDTVITGSYNFSNSAEKKNDENVLIIHCPEIAYKYIREFERLIAM